MKLRTIVEALDYTPEKIDSFVAQATKDVEDAKKIFSTIKAKVEHYSIGSLAENPNEAQALLEKLTKAHERVKNLHTKYYDIVDMYDYLDSPKNVKNLDKLVTKLDYLEMDFGNLKDALDYLLDAANNFKRFSADEES